MQICIDRCKYQITIKLVQIVSGIELRILQQKV